MKSNGDGSLPFGVEESEPTGIVVSESESGSPGPSSWVVEERLGIVGTAGKDLDMKPGIGNDDAAGEEWKVGPAYACFSGVDFLLGDSRLL